MNVVTNRSVLFYTFFIALVLVSAKSNAAKLVENNSDDENSSQQLPNQNKPPIPAKSLPATPATTSDTTEVTEITNNQKANAQQLRKDLTKSEATQNNNSNNHLSDSSIFNTKNSSQENPGPLSDPNPNNNKSFFSCSIQRILFGVGLHAIVAIAIIAYHKYKKLQRKKQAAAKQQAAEQKESQANTDAASPADPSNATEDQTPVSA